jgi:hypothetical protein
MKCQSQPPVPLPAWRPAYGWPADILEEDALAKLLEINLARAALKIAAKRKLK